MKMPRIDLTVLWKKLSKDDMAIVRRIIREDTWRLRTTRPILRESNESRYAAYVWRMVAFLVSPNSKHHCMPTTCFWWLPKNMDKTAMQRLNRLVDEITDTVPANEWWGCLAWRGIQSSDDADMRKFCLKGMKNNVPKYLEDSANRKVRIIEARNRSENESRWDLRNCERASSAGCPL